MDNFKESVRWISNDERPFSEMTIGKLFKAHNSRVVFYISLIIAFLIDLHKLYEFRILVGWCYVQKCIYIYIYSKEVIRYH